MVKRMVVLGMDLMLLLGTARAQEGPIEVDTLEERQSWHGYLIDTRYADAIAQDPATAVRQAVDYSKTMVLQKDPAAGFGLLTKGQWLKFDKDGSMKALDVIRQSNRTRGFLVTVSGKQVGDSIHVSSVEEIPDEYLRQR